MTITRQIAVDLERRMLERFEFACNDYLDSMQRMGSTSGEAAAGIGAALLNLTAEYLAPISPPIGDPETGALLTQLIRNARKERKARLRSKT